MNATETASDAADAVATIASSISEYGIMIVICAMMLVIFMVGIMLFIRNSINNANAVNTQNTQLITELIKQNNEFSDKLMELHQMQSQPPQLCQQPAETYDKKNIVDIFLELNTVLKGTCKNTQEALGAGRVAVYVFHNGAVSSHGLPFFKMTCVSEWISRGSGFTVKIHEETNLPLSIFSSVVEHVRRSNTPHIYVQDEIKTTEPVFYSWMVSNGIKTCFIQGIYSSADNTPMCYATVEFCDDVDVEAILPLIQHELKQACVKCAPVLEFSNFQKYKYGE